MLRRKQFYTYTIGFLNNGRCFCREYKKSSAEILAIIILYLIFTLSPYILTSFFVIGFDASIIVMLNHGHSYPGVIITSG
ncbi:hypothetical protein FS594_24245 (plasmid) [Rahnella aquatilis]|nr:hypothetical protein FS594_24245 [Rahnella aquatilis]